MTGGRRLADVEAGEPFGLLVVDLDVLDVGVARPAANELDHPLHRVIVALEDGLDRAIGAVGHPAGNAGGPGCASRGIAKEDSLHPSMRYDALPRHRPTSAVNARNSYATFAASNAVT